MALHIDQVFVPIDLDHGMERIAGGNETEVYATDDHRYVVKIKAKLGGDIAKALQEAQTMRACAEQFAEGLGRRHSIPSYYLLSRDSIGHIQVLVMQPYLKHAHPLHDVDFSALSKEQRQHVALQLHDLIRRALLFYRTTGSMPDLYGRTSTDVEERKRLNTLAKLPWRIWSFLIERNLLRSHNLLLTNAPECRLVLVDYDFVRQSKLYRRVYYTVRWLLFWRDHVVILRMRRGGAASIAVSSMMEP